MISKQFFKPDGLHGAAKSRWAQHGNTVETARTKVYGTPVKLMFRLKDSTAADMLRALVVGTS